MDMAVHLLPNPPCLHAFVPPKCKLKLHNNNQGHVLRKDAFCCGYAKGARAKTRAREASIVYDSEDERDGYTTVHLKENAQFMEDVEKLLTEEERTILANNASPDLTRLSSPKWKLLHTFATSGQIVLLENLLRQGVDIDTSDKDGRTALQKSIQCKKEAVVSRLLKRGANPHVKDKGGATPLHYAVLVGAIRTVRSLILKNVDVNMADIDGWTPLHVAVQSRNRNIAKVLLLKGADKELKNKTCTDQVFRFTSSSKTSIFPTTTFDTKSYNEKCRKTYGVTSKTRYASVEFGYMGSRNSPKSIGGNIVFINGLSDPWSGGAVLRNHKPW